MKPDRVEDFESIYREDGDWAELFREGPGFVSTTLMKDLRDPRRYMVADRWTGEELYEEVKRTHAARYDALDRRCRTMIERETELGRFDFLH